MSNSLDQGQLEDRTRSLVLSGHDQGFGSDLGAAVDLLGDDDDADDAQGLRAPVAIANVQDLARPSRRLSTGSASKTAGDTGDSSDYDSGSDRKKGKRFDVASETQKFKRRAETLCTKMRTRMDQLVQQMQGQLDVSRNMSHERFGGNQDRLPSSSSPQDHSIETASRVLLLPADTHCDSCVHECLVSVAESLPDYTCMHALLCMICVCYACISGRCRPHGVSTRQEVRVIRCSQQQVRATTTKAW